MMRFIEMLYADPLLKFLVDTTMKSFVIFAVAGVFAFCLRHRSAAMRGFVWSLAIIGCLIIPLFSLVLPKWELGILPEAPVSIASSQLSTKPVSSIPIAPIPPQPNPVTSQSGPLTAMHWTDWIAIVWAGVGLFLFIRLIVGIGAIWHVSARSNNFSRAVEDFRSNWNRRANVRLSNRITVPIVWGFLRPVILLPVDANRWRTERLRAVLLHELAHIKRWDWVVQTIAQVTCAVYWFNPFVWFAARRMRIEAEQACDDHVLNTGYRSTDYAQHLFDVTRDLKIAKTTSRTAVAIARSSKIEGRLRTVLAENLNRHPVTKVAAGIGLLVFICFAVPMSAMHLAQAVNPEETLNQQIQEVSMSQSTPNEDRSDETTKPSQADKNIEICKQHLVEIGKVIQAYQKEHGDFPEWLSDLHPKHLADANTLICPADEEGGKTIFPMNTDPKMPVSYGYQFHPEYREEKSTQREMYGDVIPLVRCRHHENEDFDCLNLSFSSKIYKSSAVWEFTLEDLYGSHEAVITALEDALARHPDNQRFFEVYPQLIRLYTKVGNEQSANALIERLKSGMIPDLDGYRMLFDVLVRIERYEEMLEIFKEAEQQHPDAEPILWRLAHIYRKLGNIELADVYDRKADPKYELWGKPVTDFSVTDLDGSPISLQDYRGKVVLLDFWGVWCGFCIDEMPNLKKIYATYKDQGFDIIGVSLDDEESELRDYLKENDIQWRQIYSGERWKDDPLAQQYEITGVPEQWLIDRDGKLITHKARGEDLERLVLEALKDKSANQ